MSRLVAILLLLLLASPVQASPAQVQEEPTGEVRGRVLDGGPGGPGVPGIEVTLTHLSMVPMDPQTAVTDQTGGFTFEDLPMGPRHGYIVSVDYEEVTYESGFLRALSGETELLADVIVYASTGSDEALTIARLHDVITFSPGILEVLEVLVLQNSGNSAIAPEGGVGIAVPDGARDLSFLEEDLSEAVALGNGELVITAPLLPGTTELVYLYRIPISGPLYRWEVPLSYRTGAVNLLVQNTGIEVETRGLTFQGEVQPGTEETYLLWSGEELEAGEILSVSFRGLPSLLGAPAPAPIAPAEDGDPQGWIRFLGAVLLPAGAAVATLYAVYRGRRAPSTADAETPSEGGRQMLLERMAHLDDAFAEGRISEGRYRRERRLAKGQLAALMEPAEPAESLETESEEDLAED